MTQAKAKPAAPTPEMEALKAENATLKAQVQALLERRNALLIEAYNAADMARAQEIEATTPVNKV